ncbi:PoNe immunity protein domain-containing protein [Winogradskyella sp.]|uniref:PoNe immunity protein domain-containing protein n=1 Tax=Winogradskyella sp. TaxID=1883156 RepID=UPI003BACC2A3
MIRDIYKSKQYFDSSISKREQLIEKNILRIEQGSVKPDRVTPVKEFRVGLYKKNMIARYSRGDATNSDKIKEDFNNAVILSEKTWEPSKRVMKLTENKKSINLNQFSFSGYLDMIRMLSFGILINSPKNIIDKLVLQIDGDKIKDFLLEFLIRYYDTNRPLVTEESYREFFHINERFGRLKSIIKEENKTTAEQELKYFLEKEWYESFKGTPLYNQHLNPNDTYSGYWCFVAAAIVKIKGLDDSSFRTNTYYPKDILA